MSEPTIADVLQALEVMKTEQRTTTLELRVAIAELRGGMTDLRSESRSEMAMLRADLAGFKLMVANQFDDIRRRLDTLFDELAAFRAEQHTHEPPPAAA